ncbi:hypothetical protein A5848_000530, partial [Enterococcus faecium]
MALSISNQETYSYTSTVSIIRYQLTDYDIFISRVVKDTKSGRGGVSIFFMVRNSLYEYEYDYSLEENNWLRGYHVRRGNYRS